MNAGIDNGGNTMSFWRLLKHYSIRIPAIQRDYVQGRGDVQSANARTGMLDDIQTHISDRTQMSLNFIYGPPYTSSIGLPWSWPSPMPVTANARRSSTATRKP